MTLNIGGATTIKHGDSTNQQSVVRKTVIAITITTTPGITTQDPTAATPIQLLIPLPIPTTTTANSVWPRPWKLSQRIVLSSFMLQL